jgi:hypothetical protein
MSHYLRYIYLTYTIFRKLDMSPSPGSRGQKILFSWALKKESRCYSVRPNWPGRILSPLHMMMEKYPLFETLCITNISQAVNIQHEDDFYSWPRIYEFNGDCFFYNVHTVDYILNTLDSKYISINYSSSLEYVRVVRTNKHFFFGSSLTQANANSGVNIKKSIRAAVIFHYVQ